MKLAPWLLILSLLLVTAYADAQTTITPEASPLPVNSTVIVADIYVRGGPGRLYIPVGSLVEGDVVRPVGRNADSSWVMIAYYTGFGWIRRDLAFWVEDIDSLPVVDADNLTPSPIPGPETATPFFPTPTPAGNWVEVGPQGAFVRAGPGRSYLRLDTLESGTVIEEPVGQNSDGSWIMFRFGDGFGWIATNLVRWVDDLDDLPVLEEDALTPSATYTPSDTPTLTPTPTATSTATPTATPTSTYTPTLTPSDTPTMTATATRTTTPTSTATETATATFMPTDTPTATRTNTLTPLPTDTATVTATEAPTETSTLTQTATVTVTPTASATDTPLPTETPTPMATNTSTPTATQTITPTATDEPTSTLTSTATPSETLQPTATDSDTPAPTATDEPTSTLTSTPSDTPTNTVTMTSTPTEIMTDTAEPTLTALSTDTPDITATFDQQGILAAPTLSSTPRASRTPVPTRRPSNTPTRTPSLTSTATATDTSTVTATASPTQTATATMTATRATTATETLTRTPAPTSAESEPTAVPATETPAAAIGAVTPPPPTLILDVVEPSGDSGGRLPLEAIIGGMGVLAVISYIALYLRGLAAVDRYAAGFVVDQCPVCQRGNLHVENRQSRLLGIPRPRRIVRCDSCRSMLRETGNRRWRYAVDPAENMPLFERYNGREIDEDVLVELSRQPLPKNRPPKPPVQPPTFIDHDDQ